MMLCIPNMLSAAEVKAFAAAAPTLPFGDGKTTAGVYAKAKKANDQALPGAARDTLLKTVTTGLQSNPVFQSAVRPRNLTPLILSRYNIGQTYGTHVDDALMRGLRTDVSFTLFLSDPDSYDGGELIIEDSLEERAVKLSAGDLFIYPSTTLHRVAPVTRGTRLAVVGWAQSWIRDAGKREVLFDLDRSIAAIHAEQGATPVFETLAKTRSNLLRMWVDA